MNGKLFIFTEMFPHFIITSTKERAFENSYEKLKMKKCSSPEELYSPGNLKSDSQELETSVVWSKEQVAQSPAECPPPQLSDTFGFCAPVFLHSLLSNIRQSWCSSTKCTYVLTFFTEKVLSNIPHPFLYLNLLVVYIV